MRQLFACCAERMQAIGRAEDLEFLKHIVPILEHQDERVQKALDPDGNSVDLMRRWATLRKIPNGRLEQPFFCAPWDVSNPAWLAL